MSEHEARARAVKVDKLIEALCIVYHGQCPPPDVVEHLSEKGWADLLIVAGIRSASPATRRALVSRVTTRADLAADGDPFAGFPA